MTRPRHLVTMVLGTLEIVLYMHVSD